MAVFAISILVTAAEVGAMVIPSSQTSINGNNWRGGRPLVTKIIDVFTVIIVAVGTPGGDTYVTGTGVVAVTEKRVNLSEGCDVVPGIVMAVVAGTFVSAPVSAPDTAVCKVG